MGYDMRAVQQPPGATEKRHELMASARVLYDQRDALGQASCPARVPGSVAWDESTGTQEWWGFHRQAEAKLAENSEVEGYFRLNIWGMGLCRELMSNAGMLDVEAERGRYPRAADFGADDGVDPEDAVPGSPEAACEAARLEWRSASTGGLIPAYKLGSNDGWLVTPTEIRNSLDALERHGPVAGAPTWWPDWVSYLRKMVERGGFEVY